MTGPARRIPRFETKRMETFHLKENVLNNHRNLVSAHTLAENPKSTSPKLTNRELAASHQSWLLKEVESGESQKKIRTFIESPVLDLESGDTSIYKQYISYMETATNAKEISEWFWDNIEIRSKKLNPAQEREYVDKIAEGYVQILKEEYQNASPEGRARIREFIEECESKNAVRQQASALFIRCHAKDMESDPMLKDAFAGADRLNESIVNKKGVFDVHEKITKSPYEVRMAYYNKYRAQYKTLLPELFEKKNLSRAEVSVFKEYCAMSATSKNCGHIAFEGKVDDLTVGGHVIQSGEAGADMIYVDFRNKRFILSADMAGHGEIKAGDARAIMLYLNHVLLNNPDIDIHSLYKKIDIFSSDILDIQGSLSITEINGRSVKMLGSHPSGGLFKRDGATGKVEKIEGATALHIAGAEMSFDSEIREFRELKPRDRLLIVSDGLTENMLSGKTSVYDAQFRKFAENILNINPNLSAADLLHVMMYLYKIKNLPIQDDVTLFSIENNPNKKIVNLQKIETVDHNEATRPLTDNELVELMVPDTKAFSDGKKRRSFPRMLRELKEKLLQE